MISIRLKGGMGNQMFQYALGLNLANRLNTELKLDLSALLDRSKGDFVYRNYDLSVFNVQNNFLHAPVLLSNLYRFKSSRFSKLIRKQVGCGKNYIKETHFHFQPELIQQPVENTIYEGWFQSPKYFSGVESELSNHFTFKHQILPKSKTLLERIENTNAVCLNVRRTDFLKVDNLNTTSKSYFLDSAEEIAGRVKDPHFFIFSDDISWCRENIQLSYPMEVVDHSHKGFKFSNYMQLMSRCKHFIIPNSSFAWWAIWLNQEKTKTVIAPKNWFNDPNIDTTDLVPEEWLRF